MTYKIDHIQGKTLEWYKENGEPKYRTNPEYTPSLYVKTNCNNFQPIKQTLHNKKQIKNIKKEKWRTKWRNEPEKVLKIQVKNLETVQGVAKNLRNRFPGKKYEFFNVDFSRQFRYCLETNTKPVPNEELTKTRIQIPKKELSHQKLTKIKINNQAHKKTEKENIIELNTQLKQENPDILILSNAELIPLLHKKSNQHNLDLELGRIGGYQKLAGKNTYTSYGNVGHSNARYNVLGRAIIDESNTFFYHETNLEGLLDLVKRSWKPIQELAWGSIGNILTAIQIRKALQEGVLVPWKAWRPEMFKTLKKLHKADRGGFIFSPKVGIHKNVYEADFSSLYPNIICEHNISPETIKCGCHDNEKVPEVGYSICQEKGYLPQVLKPLIKDRKEIKKKIEKTKNEKKRQELKTRSKAIKWILVACFGYQGFSNAKFGRIECHESINAFAREIMLRAKETFENEGWRILHGIIDSIWIQPQKNHREQEIQEICQKISDQVGVDLEYENRYEWLAFCSRRESRAGALTRYFGKKKNGDYKVRGIELRQKSTPQYIKEKQSEMLKRFDKERAPEPVLELLKKQLKELEREDVDPKKLLIKKSVSKEPEQYKQRNLNWSALKRAEKQSYNVEPGQQIQYIVTNNQKQGRKRIKMHYEETNQYDTQYYKKLLIKAAESILSPLNWNKNRIHRYLEKNKETKLKTSQKTLKTKITQN